jgi:protoheme IX farnesyltransferase
MPATAETNPMRSIELDAASALPRVRHLLRLTKPRVVSLIVFTAVIGMFLAVPGLPPASGAEAGRAPAQRQRSRCLNCLVEQRSTLQADAGTATWPMGELTSAQTLIFAVVIGGTGLGVLYALVNPMTMAYARHFRPARLSIQSSSNHLHRRTL